MVETIVGVVALIVGLGVGKIIFGKAAKNKEEEAEQKAKLIIKEAEVNAEAKGKEKMLEAKEKFIKMKADFEEDINKKKNIILQNEQKLKSKEQSINHKEQSLNQKLEDVNRKTQEIKKAQEKISTNVEILKKKRNELEKERKSVVGKLEKIAQMSAEEAKEQLMDTLTKEASTKASAKIKDILEEAKLTATKDAKKVVLETIQRTAAEQAIENCVSVFNLDSDELKGKIIGREGRNIRALEAATGIEIIVDDTPEAIIISGYDPVRRETARLALHKLVKDGRIHPARIEEIVAKTKKDLNQEMIELGERTVIDLGINGLHPELIKLVGRMRFRSSYGQNLLQHSREVAKLCATMASELGLDAKKAKRAGLLHDIGKVAPEENELPHALWGMEIAKKYKEHPDICNAIGAHHDEIEMTAMISPIVQACDAISGSRPGARREVMESYMKRLKDLEEIAMSFDGVEKCYAIQAGRELRIMVDAENITDEVAGTLSFDISQKIENDMQYPGQIKITVIREMRAINYAK